MSDGIHDGWDFGGAAEVPGILVIKGTIVWRCLIEDHRPLLADIARLCTPVKDYHSDAPCTDPLVNRARARVELKRIQRLRARNTASVNGGGHGQGNGTAG